MFEGGDHGEGVVDMACDTCTRSVPAFLHEETLSLWFDAVTERDGEQRESELRAETVCGDCADEIRSLTDEMAGTDRPSLEDPTCGLCRTGFDEDVRALTLRGGDAHEGTGDRFVLCPNCHAIFEEFLENVPEHGVDGDRYTGGADTVRDDVDESVDVFDSLYVGDEIRVVSWRVATTEDTGTSYERSGTVVRRSATHGIVHVAVATTDGLVRVTRPAPTVHQLTLQQLDEDADEVGHLGTVTSLDVTNQVAREEISEPESMLELDADSALIPESLDLESSAD